MPLINCASDANATRRGFKKLGYIAAAAATSAASLLIAAIPASAEIAPSCIETNLNDEGFTDYLYIHNNCGSTQRVKVVLAFKQDFACRSLPDGGGWEYWWVYPARFDRVELC